MRTMRCLRADEAPESHCPGRGFITTSAHSRKAQDWRAGGRRRAVKPSLYGIQTPLTCRLTCSELVFDNRRGGERACGNQVDADGAAWTVRGSRDFWARRSGPETRGPTECPRAEHPRAERPRAEWLRAE